MSQYLSEAFKKLDTLNEETFSVTDSGLQDFIEFTENDENEDIIDIIDVDAETVEDLEDSYIGKIILDCCVCHSKLYKDTEDVIIEDDLANVDEECPFCYANDGYKIVGQVAAFGEEEVEEKDDDEKVEETKDDEELEESFVSKESKNKEVREFLPTPPIPKISGLLEDEEKDLDEFMDANITLDARGFGGKDNNVSVLGGKIPFGKNKESDNKSIKESGGAGFRLDNRTILNIEDLADAVYRDDEEYIKKYVAEVNKDINVKDLSTAAENSDYPREIKNLIAHMKNKGYNTIGDFSKALNESKSIKEKYIDASDVSDWTQNSPDEKFSSIGEYRGYTYGKLVSPKDVSGWYLIDGPDNIVIGNLSDNTYSSKQELITALRTEIHRLSLDESKSIKESLSIDDAYNKVMDKFGDVRTGINDDYDTVHTGMELAINDLNKEYNKSKLFNCTNAIEVRQFVETLISNLTETFKDYANVASGYHDVMNYLVRSLLTESKSIRESGKSIDDILDTLGGHSDFYEFLKDTIEAYPGVEDDIDEIVSIIWDEDMGVDEEELASAIEYIIDDVLNESKSIREDWEDIKDWEDTENYDFEAEYNQALKEVTDQLDNYGEEEAAEYLYMNNHIFKGYKAKIAKELGIESEYRKWTTPESKSINEDINNLSLDTDDTHMEMTSDENGKVTITTEPLDNTKVDENETIAPIEPEVQNEIESNVANGEEIDIDVDEFDEESFDELGEGYLKKVYENVDSFKTSKVSYSDNKLVLEGVIKFNSGKAKKTTFLFENKLITKKGKVRFIGENKEIAKGKKSFTITGRIDDKKFLSESFNYNYGVKTPLGKVKRLYGTINK